MNFDPEIFWFILKTNVVFIVEAGLVFLGIIGTLVAIDMIVKWLRKKHQFKRRDIMKDAEKMKMIILFGGNEYEILDEDIKSEIVLLLMPVVMSSAMGKSNEVLCRKQPEKKEE